MKLNFGVVSGSKKIKQSQLGCSHFLLYRNKELKEFLLFAYLQVTNQTDYTSSIRCTTIPWLS